MLKDEEMKVETVEKSKTKKGQRKGNTSMKEKEQTVCKKVLTVQDGTELPLTGIGIYFIRTSSKRTLGYERNWVLYLSMIANGICGFSGFYII